MGAAVDAATRRRAWEAIEAIARDLEAHTTSAAPAAQRVEDPMLSGGRIGLALFFAYLDAARGDGGRGEAAGHAVAALAEAIEAMGEVDLSPSLYNGFCGVAWVTEHLKGRLDPETFAGDDLNDEIDAVLATFLAAPGLVQPYELIRGVAGFGVYLLERLQAPGARELLGRVLGHLEATAEESPEGLTWWTEPSWIPTHRRVEFPHGNYNLGVAHGVPGVLGFAAAARRAGVDDPRLERFAEGVVGWLAAQRLPAGGDCDFPALLVPEAGGSRPSPHGDLRPHPSRTAWCYGDLGIACVLLAAARAFARTDWEAEAVALARRAARRTPEAGRVVDASLCHGAAGNAHLFLRLAQATADAELAAAGGAWLERALAMRRPGEGVGGYLAWGVTPRGEGWRPETGLLTGAAGVGLALLAVAAEVEPAWDRLLLLAPGNGVR